MTSIVFIALPKHATNHLHLFLHSNNNIYYNKIMHCVIGCPNCIELVLGAFWILPMNGVTIIFAQHEPNL